MPSPIQPTLVALAALALAPAGVYAAATIGSLAPQPNPTAGHGYTGQSFTVPAGETGLQSGSLLIHVDSGTATGTLGVYGYSEPGGVPTIGAPVALSAFSVPAGAPQTLSATFNTTVVPGNAYVLLADWTSNPSTVGGYFSNASYYAGGQAILEGAGVPVAFSSFDLAFQVNFGEIPEPASLAALAGVAFASRRRRR